MITVNPYSIGLYYNKIPRYRVDDGIMLMLTAATATEVLLALWTLWRVFHGCHCLGF